MDSPLFTPTGNTKAERYAHFLQLYAPFIEGESDAVTAMANTAAALREAFGFFWVGFYVVKPSTPSSSSALTTDAARAAHLQLGPFQGPPACSQIRYGRGVCGTAWQRQETLVVPDVSLFPGHIACSSLSRSEIVVPVKDTQGEVIAVLDIDSTELSGFDDNDRLGLERVISLLAPSFGHNSQSQ